MTLADRLLILVVVPGIALFAYKTWQPSAHASQVEIVTPFEKNLVLLDQSKTITIHGALGKSEINIEQHRVRFSSSPCKSKFCIHQGWAEYTNDLRACLPNKVSLRLLGQASRFDSITF